MSEVWPEGIYETLRTNGLTESLRQRDDLDPAFELVEPALAPDVLARHIASIVGRAVADEPDEARRIALTNRLLAELARQDARVEDRIETLMSIRRRSGTPVSRPIRPVTPLSAAALLTNAPDEPSLGSELRAELATADQVSLLCAFIKWHGLRVLETALDDLRARGVPLRVITTTYVGATERRAVDELVRRFGAEVRITYEIQSTRLHAKAWLFRRRSGFDTAFVGSSNLSRSALVDGLEWNVRLSGVSTPELLRKFDATFESYWQEPGFLRYDPDRDAGRLDDALARSGSRQGAGTSIISGLEVRPFPHQIAVLEALQAERQLRDRHRNLVVAATGTGKTVIAALDYRNLLSTDSTPPRLLFVAHRQEILQQSLRTYREVLARGSFGEEYVAGKRPDRWQHVFASVQSLNAYGIERIPRDHFDVVVVDEFHHSEAPTYRRILDHLQPRELLGLTATPERSDGVDVRDWFGGRSAYELRLWDALSADLLAPFHYFGVADDVDLRGVDWKRGSYTTEGLDRVYTGNDARAAKVIRELTDKVTDVGRMRGLGFCVSVAHAEYMAEVFSRAGIPSKAVSGQTPAAERMEALSKLRGLELNCLFAADLFNEGLDLPEIDTVLFLRPTQSATVFLQQLGRGLRRAPGKAVLTVLDFIGMHRREFRFDLRLRALTGTSRVGLQRAIEQGCPFLPSGSQMVLDRVAQQVVLENVRQQLRFGRRELVADVRSHGELSLAGYLREAGRDLADVYKDYGSWTSVKREAGMPVPEAGPDEKALLRRAHAVAHVDDPERARLYTEVATAGGREYADLAVREQILARMLFFALWPNRGSFVNYEDGFRQLRRHEAVCDELRQLVAFSLDRARTLPQPLSGELGNIPLQSHATYRREELLAALGWANWERSARGNITGVAWAESTRTDALMINLRKSERQFSPSTMYRDYAISPELFHWESQNATSTASPAGRRYLSHEGAGSHVLLFVREGPRDELGAAPFTCLGQATYQDHRGERPIAITWRLERAMPAEIFRMSSVVA